MSSVPYTRTIPLVNNSTNSLYPDVSIPLIGLGTWQSDPKVVGNEPSAVEKAVKTALAQGYRHIDCAYAYGNEKGPFTPYLDRHHSKLIRWRASEVGKAIKDSGIPRSELFITSKVWSTFHRDPKKNLDLILSNLGTDYLDRASILTCMRYKSTNIARSVAYSLACTARPWRCILPFA